MWSHAMGGGDPTPYSTAPRSPADFRAFAAQGLRPQSGSLAPLRLNLMLIGGHIRTFGPTDTRRSGLALR